jgi:hypothetical protein
LIAGEELGRRPRFRVVGLEDVIPYYRSDCIMDGVDAYDLLDYRPSISLRDGIGQMVRELQSEMASTG